MKDKEIIEGCKKGLHAAYEELYKQYSSKLMAIALRYTASKAQAEDILQDAFIKIFKNIQKFDDKGSFEGWLKRIVVRTAIDAYHVEKINWTHEGVSEYKDLGGTDYETIVSKLSLDEIKEKIQKLPEGYKLVFNLHVIEGYTHQEIGEMLGIAEGTSRSQLAKAKKMLQGMLQKMNLVAHGK